MDDDIIAYLDCSNCHDEEIKFDLEILGEGSARYSQIKLDKALEEAGWGISISTGKYICDFCVAREKEKVQKGNG